MDEWLLPDRETGEARHTLVPVYTEMIFQIASDFPGLPDPRTMTLSEIRWWYEGVRPALKKHTAPKEAKPFRR